MHWRHTLPQERLQLSPKEYKIDGMPGRLSLEMPRSHGSRNSKSMITSYMNTSRGWQYTTTAYDVSDSCVSGVNQTHADRRESTLHRKNPILRPTDMTRFTLLAVLILHCLASAAQRVIMADLWRRQRVKYHELSDREAAFGATLIQKPDKSVYWINITVGTPRQEQSLQLDTGSHTLWMPAKGSPLCSSLVDCAELGSFDRSKSSTFEGTGQTTTVGFLDGSSITGIWFYDTVRIDRQTVKQQLAVSGRTGSGIHEGVLGVGFPASYPTINHNLAAQGVISSNMYSLWLDDLDSSKGTILFGGLNVAKFVAPLLRVPVVGSTNSDGSVSFNLPTVALTRVATLKGSASTRQTLSGYSENAVLDTGTTLIVLQKPLADKIIDAMGAEYYPTDATSGTTIIPCTHANRDLSINFHFGGTRSGPTINVDVSDMVLQSLGSLNGVEMCQFGLFTSDGSYLTVLGDTFLRSAYVVYDLDRNQIGLAQSIVNSGDANIVEGS